MPTTNLEIPYITRNLTHPEDPINAALDIIDAAVGALQSPLSARAYNNANIAVSNNSEQALTLNSERWDTAGIHSTSVNAGRLTVPSDGKYVIDYTLFFASNATGYRYIYVRLNGTTALNFDTRNAVTGQVTALAGSVVYDFVAGDYVELVVLQNSGGSLNVTTSANNSPEFGLTKLG
jgi:hypothetical protein